MNNLEFCKAIIEGDGVCKASRFGNSPWGRTCTKGTCPIYQEMPCYHGKAVRMAHEWIKTNQEVK